MTLVQRESSAPYRSERREYRLLYAVSFPLFLTVSLLSRLLPADLRPLAIERGSYFAVIRDARASACSILPHAFMR